MKIFFAICLAVLLTTTVTQLYASEVLSANGNEEITTENGTDIRVTKPELMEVVVSNNSLTFEICTMNCKEEFLVCYEPDPPLQNTTDFIDGICDPLCGFYVTGGKNVTKSEKYVAYTNPTERIKRDETCDTATMTLRKFLIRNGPGGGGNLFQSCKPKIENGLLKLNVTMASPDCPVIIKNAQFKRDPPTTTTSPSNKDPNKTDSPSGNSSSNVFGIYGWIFAFISLFILHQ